MTTEAFDGATVLVTGGTGSFGSSLVRRMLGGRVKEVRVFSRDELKQHEMSTALADERVRFFIGDVRDRDALGHAMDGVEFVFHAAALKQVPTCELFPLEALKTNVLGTENVLRAANEARVRSVVFLSTDKAVLPANAMGLSKSMAEKVIQALARNGGLRPDLRLSIVRYGNVMWSRGSVLPLFVRQARSGAPMTVTDPAMTRFLITLDEAIDLVEHALAVGDNGDVFVRLSPAATVGDLAAGVAEALGVPATTIEVGIRPGEKIHETLLTAEEMAGGIQTGDIMRVPANRPEACGGVNDSAATSPAEVASVTSDAARRYGVHEVAALVLRLQELHEVTTTRLG